MDGDEMGYDGMIKKGFVRRHQWLGEKQRGMVLAGRRPKDRVARR